jgi:hypothetical protein
VGNCGGCLFLFLREPFYQKGQAGGRGGLHTSSLQPNLGICIISGACCCRETTRESGPGGRRRFGDMGRVSGSYTSHSKSLGAYGFFMKNQMLILIHFVMLFEGPTSAPFLSAVASRECM